MRYLLLTTTLCLFVGCSDSGSETKTNVPDELHGSWKSERHYVNTFFGVEVEIPETWTLLKGKPPALSEETSDMLAGNDRRLKSTIKEAVDKTFNPFWAHRYPPGTPGKTNSNVTFIIEKIAHLPEVKSGEDYLLVLEETLQMSSKEVTFVSRPEKTIFADAEYYTAETKISMNGMIVMTRYYVKMKGDYILLIGTNYIPGEGEKTVAEVMDKVKGTEG